MKQMTEKQKRRERIKNFAAGAVMAAMAVFFVGGEIVNASGITVNPWTKCACRAANEKQFGQRSRWKRMSDPLIEGMFRDREGYERKSKSFTRDQHIILGLIEGEVPQYVVEKCGNPPLDQ